MRKSNLGKTLHTHLGIQVFEDALREENQSNCEADQQNAARTLRRTETESEE
jgi:hypothetical protein